MTQAYPLAWPAHRPRRTSGWKNGKFTKGGAGVTNADSISRVREEVRKLGGTNLLISSNVALRLDGFPRSGQSEPADRGVCVYFTLKGEPLAMACDRYTTVADNLAAIAAHLGATRAIERHGVASAAETLQAFALLAAPASAPSVRPWREVMCVPVGRVTSADIRVQYRVLATERHPDAPNGSHEAMAELNAARDAALKELTA